MKSFKSETVKQLNIRRSSVASSLSFAETKLSGLQGPELSTNQQTQKNEFEGQRDICTAQLQEIDSCIKWLALII